MLARDGFCTHKNKEKKWIPVVSNREKKRLFYRFFDSCLLGKVFVCNKMTLFGKVSQELITVISGARFFARLYGAPSRYQSGNRIRPPDTSREIENMPRWRQDDAKMTSDTSREIESALQIPVGK